MQRFIGVATTVCTHVFSLYERLLACGKFKMAALGAAMRKLAPEAKGLVELPDFDELPKEFMEHFR